MRVLVTGGRDFKNSAMVRLALSQLPADAVLVHGAASGADTLAAKQWEAWGRATEAHPADWSGPCRETCEPGHRGLGMQGKNYCPAAGPYRNQEMLDSGIDLLIVFPGGRGTADMTHRAHAAGVALRFADQIPVTAG